MTRTGDWDVSHRAGSADALHHRELPDPPRRLVEVLAVDRPTVVLGSTQPESLLDPVALAASGLAVARRRSGGGAVLLVPGESLWVDVAIPPWDDLWLDDVSRSFDWLGRAWVAALADLGITGRVHEGGLCTTEWSRLVCWGGLGSGEVTAPGWPPSTDAAWPEAPGGPKIVGLAQRRGRTGARFQCALHHEWDPGRLVDVLALAPAEREAAAAALQPVAHEVPADDEAIVGALLDHLPS